MYQAAPFQKPVIVSNVHYKLDYKTPGCCLCCGCTRTCMCFALLYYMHTLYHQGQWQAEADKRVLAEQAAPLPPGLGLSSTDSAASGLTVGLKDVILAPAVAQPNDSTCGEKLPVSTTMKTFESEDFHKDPLGSTSSKASEVKVSIVTSASNVNASIDSAYASTDLPQEQQWGGLSSSAQLQPQQEWGAKQQSGSLGNGTGTASHDHGGGGMLYNSIWSPSPQPGVSPSLVLEGWGSKQERCPQVDDSSDTFVGKPPTSQTDWLSSSCKPEGKASDSPVAQLQPLLSSEPLQAQRAPVMAGDSFSDFLQSVEHEAKWSPTGQQDTPSLAQAQPDLRLKEPQATEARFPSDSRPEPLEENPLPSRDPVLPAPSDQFQTPGTGFLTEKQSDSSFEDPAILEKGYKCKALEEIPAQASLQGEAVLGRSTNLALLALPHSSIPPVDAAMNVSCLPPSSEHSKDTLAHGLDPPLEASTHFSTPGSAHHTGSHSHHHRHCIEDLFSSPRTEMVCGETRSNHEAKTGSQSTPFQLEIESASVHVSPPGLTSNPMLDSSLTLGTGAVSSSFDSYFPSAFENGQPGDETTSAKDSSHLVALTHEDSLVHARVDTATDTSHGCCEYGDSTEPDTPIAYASTNPLSYPHESLSTPTVSGADIAGDSELQASPEVPNSAELVGVHPLQTVTPIPSHKDRDSVHPRTLGYPDPWLGITETAEEGISNVSNISNASSGEEPREDTFLAELTSTSPPALWGRLSRTSNTLASSLHHPSLGTSVGEVSEQSDGGERSSECTPYAASTNDDQDSNTVEEDLIFLAECFPDLELSYLRLLLNRCSGDVEKVVSHAVLSSLNPVSPQREFTGFHFISTAESSLPSSDTETSSTLSSVGYASDQVSDNDEILDDKVEEGGKLRDIESATEVLERLQFGDTEPSGFDLQLNKQGPPATENFSTETLEGLESPDECIDDGEIAKLLQEQLNLEASEERSMAADTTLRAESHGGLHEYQEGNEPRATDNVTLPSDNLPLTEVEAPQAVIPDTTSGGEREIGGVEEGGSLADRTEDNLVLKLTPSLARQLQDMFGAVRGHLLPKGECLRSLCDCNAVKCTYMYTC